METLFPLEFRSFLDNSRICYSQEKNLFIINRGLFSIKLITSEDLNNNDFAYNAVKSDLTLHFDRWNTRREIVQSMIMVKAGLYESVFARNCFVKKIDKISASLFHLENHLLGAANAKYYYALFRKSDLKIVAVSSFSNSRRLSRGDETLQSYEWVRYSSLKGVRVVGGMSKLLNYFIKEVSPDEVMTYCDSDWSYGTSYEKLDFKIYSKPQESIYFIDKVTFERMSLNKIRRKFNSLTPDRMDEKYYCLRTKGNYKFLRRITL